MPGTENADSTLGNLSAEPGANVDTILYGDFDTGTRAQDILRGRPKWWPQEIDPLVVIPAGYFLDLSVHGHKHGGVVDSWTAVADGISDQWTDGAVRLAWNTRSLLEERSELNNIYRMIPLDECSYQIKLEAENDGLRMEIDQRNRGTLVRWPPETLPQKMAAVMEIVDQDGTVGDWRYFSHYRPDLDRRINSLFYVDAYGGFLGKVLLDHEDARR